MRIAITGGAGFIGSQLALNLQEKHEILIVDKMRSSATFENGNLQSFGHFKNLLEFDGELFAGDINDEKVLKRLKILSQRLFFIKQQFQTLRFLIKLRFYKPI